MKWLGSALVKGFSYKVNCSHVEMTQKEWESHRFFCNFKNEIWETEVQLTSWG